MLVKSPEYCKPIIILRFVDDSDVEYSPMAIRLWRPDMRDRRAAFNCVSRYGGREDPFSNMFDSDVMTASIALSRAIRAG